MTAKEFVLAHLYDMYDAELIQEAFPEPIDYETSTEIYEIFKILTRIEEDLLND